MDQLSAPRRRWLLTALGVVLLGAVIVGSVLAFGNGERGSATTWDSYEPAPGGLTIHKTLRPCDEVVGATARETPGRVEVAVYVEDGGTCGMLAVTTSITVGLDHPLGDRPVYDVACLSRAPSDQSGQECLRPSTP